MKVSIRRVIGQKKDQYYLDKKITTKKDVVQLFEAAGFSRSNPYYIVKQGKINEMATQSERDRLELFKEIAGTRVYDDKRAESMKLFKKSEEDRSKIQQGLSHIVDKLESLEQDKEDFTQVRFIVSSPSKSRTFLYWDIRNFSGPCSFDNTNETESDMNPEL